MSTTAMETLQVKNENILMETQLPLNILIQENMYFIDPNLLFVYIV